MTYKYIYEFSECDSLKTVCLLLKSYSQSPKNSKIVCKTSIEKSAENVIKPTQKCWRCQLFLAIADPGYSGPWL